MLGQRCRQWFNIELVLGYVPGCLLAGLVIRYFLSMYRSCKQETKNTGLILAQRRRRWPSNKPTLDQRIVYMGYTFLDIEDIICLHMYLITYV